MVRWLLIVSLLTFNMAWAMDTCAFSDPSGASTNTGQTLDPAPADSAGTIPVCNHWCPGWMSFVALLGSSVLLPGLLPTFEDGFDVDLYFFPPAPPPTHPPIV